eukprot:scaffold290217_cov37-Tisochrysis_lutea.AAC.2
MQCSEGETSVSLSNYSREFLWSGTTAVAITEGGCYEAWCKQCCSERRAVQSLQLCATGIWPPTDEDDFQDHARVT